MSMSKKDYELLAQSLAETQVACEAQVEGLPTGSVEGIMNAVLVNLVAHLERDNPSFRATSFRARFHDNVAALRVRDAKKVTRR